MSKQHAQKALQYSNLALAILFLAGVVRWTLMSGSTPDAIEAQIQSYNEPIQLLEIPDARAHPEVDYEALMRRDLFESAGTTSDTDLISTQLPEDLSLELLGTIAGSPDVARAILKDTGTDAIDHYRINDIIQSARIESIQRNRVILVRQGRRYQLSTVNAVDMASDEAAPSPQGTGKPFSDATTRKNMTPLETLLVHAHLDEYVVEGQSQGLRVTNINDLPLAALAGLREGDIIQRINGQSVPNKQKGFQVMQKVRSLPSLRIDLLRDGQEKELVLEW